jgi:crotonobetainyl-CoA:carnitine CoA-transferase CaiB-like acyl-CoA transferase
MRAYSASELAQRFEAHGLPFAPITKPEDLFTDVHLNANGGLQDIELCDGKKTKAVLLPITMNGQRLHIRLSPPKLGEHSIEILEDLGFSKEQIDSLTQSKS